MINLSENINFLYPNKKTINLLKDQIEIIKNYPSKKNDYLYSLMHRQLSLGENQMIITNGSLEAIDIFFKMNSGKRVGILQPTFWGYKNCAVRNSCRIVERKLDNPFEYSIEEIGDLLEETDVLILCNPNNPSLAKISLKELEVLLRRFPEKNILIDETVLTFDDNFNSTSTKQLVNLYKNLYVCFSFSKVLGVPGLRLGVLISTSDNINRVKKLIIPYSLGGIQQQFLIDNYELFPLNREIAFNIHNNFRYLISILPAGKIKNIINKNYGFILIQFTSEIVLEELCQFLMRRKVLIRNITGAYTEMGENWMRISSGSKDDYDSLVNGINEYINLREKEIGIDCK